MSLASQSGARISADIRFLDNCPECHADWHAGRIFGVLRNQSWREQKNNVELQVDVEDCYSPPYTFSRLIGITEQGGEDRVSKWRCPDCAHEWPCSR